MKKKVLVLSIFYLVSPSAQAAFLCPMIYEPPALYYGQYFQQCAESRMSVAQELACMQDYVTADPPPPIAEAQVTAFFRRGCALGEAARRGLISNAEARAQLARDMVNAQYHVQAKVQQRLLQCHSAWCNEFGYSTLCNGT